MSKEKEVRFYSSYADDFSFTKNQEYKLKKDYKWVRDGFFESVFAALLYTVALIFSTVYCRLFLHVDFKGSRILRKAAKDGAFIYGNHTQPIGDVFLPALAAFPKRIYTIVSPANLGIPFIGRLLPCLGALPLTDDLGGMKRLHAAIEKRLDEGCFITIYPEAHVWEYHTEIRPFADAAFWYPVRFAKPAYCMTVTYKDSRFFRRPRATVYIDGPFLPDLALPKKEQAKKLCESIYKRMQERSQNSNFKYIRYEKKI